ncbi:hypothetical protein [Paenibacillus macquariensis]|nr:hypothetical protein [Paenibacillus macquariensis]
MSEHPTVFNLYFKGSQLGDIYTMLFMLDQQGDINLYMIYLIRFL